MFAQAHRFASSPLREPSKSKGKEHDTTDSADSTLRKFSFERLGITGKTKWAIIGFVSIVATLETITYTKLALRWWRSRHGETEAGDDK